MVKFLPIACATLLAACAAAPLQNIDESRRILAAQADAWDKALIAKDRAGIEGAHGQRSAVLENRGQAPAFALFSQIG